MPSRRKQEKPQQQKFNDFNNNLICEKGNLLSFGHSLTLTYYYVIKLKR